MDAKECRDNTLSFATFMNNKTLSPTNKAYMQVQINHSAAMWEIAAQMAEANVWMWRIATVHTQTMVFKLTQAMAKELEGGGGSDLTNERLRELFTECLNVIE